MRPTEVIIETHSEHGKADQRGAVKIQCVPNHMGLVEQIATMPWQVRVDHEYCPTRSRLLRSDRPTGGSARLLVRSERLDIVQVFGSVIWITQRCLPRRGA